MRKVFKLQDLECANCAAKMEDAIKKIDGVNTASMSFMTQKLVIDADPEKLDAILDEARKDLPQRSSPDMDLCDSLPAIVSSRKRAGAVRRFQQYRCFRLTEAPCMLVRLFRALSVRRNTAPVATKFCEILNKNQTRRIRPTKA